jgi:cobalt-zinc-cadmium efflux system protein
MATRAHPHGPHDHRLHARPGGWRYGLAILLNIGIVAAQVAAGLATGSTALLADAGHNASDVAGLLLAGWAAWLMTRAATPRRTYGFGKAGILAALGNTLLLVFACGALSLEAARRLLDPPAAAPPGAVMMAIALLAAAVNIVSGLLLHHGGAADVNRRAAAMHLFADAGVSLAVVAAGAFIVATGAVWIDPVATLLVVAVILRLAWGLLRQSLDLALDAVPGGIDPDAVRAWLLQQPGVEGVHDLHIWPISATEAALTAHLVMPEGATDSMTGAVRQGLEDRFGLAHATLQVETTEPSCAQGCDGPHP